MYILKDAYILTLNPLNEFGRYTLLVKEGRVTDIIPETAQFQERIKALIEKYGVQCVIDCSDKIIMPGFVNSCLKSEGALIKYLLKQRHYELIKEDLSTDFILNYIYQELPSDEIVSDLTRIYEYSLTRELKCGSIFVNEITPRKDTNHFEPILNTIRTTRQSVRVCYQIKQVSEDIHKYKGLNFSIYLTDENQLTIYDLSLLNELRSDSVNKLFLEVSVNKEVSESFRKLYNKPVITFLDEYGMIDENTSLINPLYLTYEEIRIIQDKGANIIICPRDLSYFSNRYFPFDEFINHNIRFSVATGWLGEDIFQEMRLLRNRYRELNLSSKSLLESITKIPRTQYFADDNSYYYIDSGKSADLVFISINDLRFQFYPENYSYEKLCDFIVDNLSIYNISDVMIKGEFTVSNGKLLHQDENQIIKNADETRQRLYKVGKYYELQEREKQKRYIEELDLKNRDKDEIVLFSEKTQPEIKESLKEETEDFRIKGKMHIVSNKISPFQRSLFEEDKQVTFTEQTENDSPVINLLTQETSADIKNEEEIKQLRDAEAKLFRETIHEKKSEKKMMNEESKVELPKNVKLKFGDD